MIFDNIDALATAMADHRAKAQKLEKQLADIRKVRAVLGDSLTDSLKAAMIDKLSVGEYHTTDVEARRIFAATEVDPAEE